MATPVDRYLNHIPDPSTREVLRDVVEAIYADIAAIKTVYDAHTHHDGSAYTSQPATNAPGNTTGTRSTVPDPSITT